MNPDIHNELTSVRDRHRALVTSDRQLLCILGWDRAKSREAIYVYHARKGIQLSKMPLKYKGFRRPVGFRAAGDNYAVVLDSEKGSLFDVRNNAFIRSVMTWTGQATTDGRFGLSAPPG